MFCTNFISQVSECFVERAAIFPQSRYLLWVAFKRNLEIAAKSFISNVHANIFLLYYQILLLWMKKEWRKRILYWKHRKWRDVEERAFHCLLIAIIHWSDTYCYGIEQRQMCKWSKESHAKAWRNMSFMFL